MAITPAYTKKLTVPGWSAIGAIAGAVTGAAVNTVSYGVSCLGSDSCTARGVTGAFVGGAVGGAIAGACIGTTAQVMACGAAAGEVSYLLGSAIAGTRATLSGAMTSGVVGAMGNGVSSLAGRGIRPYFGRPLPGNALSNTAGAVGSALTKVDWASPYCDPNQNPDGYIGGGGVPNPANMVPGSR